MEHFLDIPGYTGRLGNVKEGTDTVNPWKSVKPN
jgi:hypothetical protein